MDAKELNEALAGRTITKVEEGTTKRWIVLNFDLPPEMQEGRFFLTIAVDAGDDPYNSQCALHAQACEGGGHAYNVRDKR